MCGMLVGEMQASSPRVIDRHPSSILDFLDNISRLLSLGTLCYVHVSGNICWSHDHLFTIHPRLQVSFSTLPKPKTATSTRTPRTSSSRASAIYKRSATQTVVAQTTQTPRVTLILLRSRVRVKASLQKMTVQAPSQGQHSSLASPPPGFEVLDEVYCDWRFFQVGFVITRASEDTPGITAGTTSAWRMVPPDPLLQAPDRRYHAGQVFPRDRAARVDLCWKKRW